MRGLFEDRARDVADISAGAWTALAAWLAVVVGTAALVYAWRQYQRAKDQTAELMQPNVAMFMEPSATGWHLIELVAIRRPSASTKAPTMTATLRPVERLELLTTHDLARQEKQKLELLRNLLTYFHYAASESREEVLRAEINRVRSAADELRDRHRAQYNAPVNNNIAFDEAHTTVINGRHRREVN